MPGLSGALVQPAAVLGSRTDFESVTTPFQPMEAATARVSLPSSELATRHV